ncbi:N(4)-(Beta-N-acetylglucosaminyl)-L-asparaginase-like isoform X2 [Oratosquilla oratoria]|uniref:N(4)-(Beta-N-acetylglucosaminyl)-L-asparaginase- like isoform X2 n=1 Tax=Oratosquilla oratoria TaxID=337810 RepID=UPI003F75CDA8
MRGSVVSNVQQNNGNEFKCSTYIMFSNIISIVWSTAILLATAPIAGGCNRQQEVKLPMVINTWGAEFSKANVDAWDTLYIKKKSVLDAVEVGCSKCEELQCDGTVGFGGDPDENGETTLDAMIMDGQTHDVGAVADLRRVKSAISVARKVMEHTSHTLLVGNQATQFAIRMGFKEEDLNTSSSMESYKKWKENKCQPNYWINVTPDPKSSCGPYSPIEMLKYHHAGVSEGYNINLHNHDTIGMIAVDEDGSIAGGTSTNGLSHKVPGRVGDSPIPGSGAYVDKYVGGAAATGDGDVMMRFSPAMLTVEGMRYGLTPDKAAQIAIIRISKYYPNFSGAIVATTIDGDYGAACHGMDTFHYCVANPTLRQTTLEKVTCVKTSGGVSKESPPW